jgi:hypothetical protein
MHEKHCIEAGDGSAVTLVLDRWLLLTKLRVTLEVNPGSHPDNDKPRLLFSFGPTVEQAGKGVPTPQYKGTNPRSRLMAAFSLTDSQQSTFAIAFVDKRGNPTAAPAGTINWMTDNVDLLGLTPAADGLSCVVASLGPIGAGVVTVNVTATDGSVLASGSVNVSVVSGAPVTINVTPGAATEQP